ncbi:MAG TPA: thioesterase family protein [Chloroflexota bacterium]|jgi:predicted thioesterase|nr:thioesterase family protein [Chloroflexota bacterium]
MLQTGLTGEAHATVDASRLASALGSGRVDVFATPAMIGLMEQAAVNAVDHLLPNGQSSVGARIDVEHVAATPPGLQVRAEAELIAVDGRRLTFRVQAFDSVERIGTGTHQRVVVDLERLLARARVKTAT